MQVTRFITERDILQQQYNDPGVYLKRDVPMRITHKWLHDLTVMLNAKDKRLPVIPLGVSNPHHLYREYLFDNSAYILNGDLMIDIMNFKDNHQPYIEERTS